MTSNRGSFLICVPRVSGLRPRERFKTVGRAAARIVQTLDADIQVSRRRNLLSIWDYYKNEEREWSPIYFDWGKKLGRKRGFQLYTKRVVSPHARVLLSPQVR